MCLGNPPYYRQTIAADEVDVERQGGWVRFGDRDSDQPGILDDYLREIDGTHAKSLYNLYVYFWRWALWKVFERPPNRGLVAFITASSYLRGPGFAGMRKHMRETFDELWILDLGGEGRGARKSANVFDIQTPVAIAVGIRTGAERKDVPATVRYARFDGTREAKYEELWSVDGIGAVDWRDCFEGWTEPLLPIGDADAGYYRWPRLADLFPWQHSGMQFKRTWPIAASAVTLESRWRSLLELPTVEKRAAFRESRDRKIDSKCRSIDGSEALLPIAESSPSTPAPPIMRISYRSLDRQYCIADSRVGDFLRPVLWKSHGPRQLYMTSLLTGLIGDGPAVFATNLVPDLHSFRGSFGAKDAIPLWRDQAATEANIAPGLLAQLGESLGREVTPEDLFAYCYAILQSPSFAQRFAEELEVPGAHVPISKHPKTFTRGVSLGERLIWLHTFGERFVPTGNRPGQVEQGDARSKRGIGSKPSDYPETFDYDESARELIVGEARFGPVSQAVWNYEVSGMFLLRSWLGYRMKAGAGKRTSSLDAIRPSVWPGAFTDQLLDLIWTIEKTVALEDELEQLFNDVLDSEVFDTDELPKPTDDDRKAPST